MIDLDTTTIVQGIALVVGLLTAYGAKADGFRRFISRFTTKATQERMAEANKDAAWRELIDDSRARKCARSVELLNQWIQLRTSDGLDGLEE